MMNPRRYEVRIYVNGTRLCPKEKFITGLDLQSGHGVRDAHVEVDRLMYRIALANGVRDKDMKYCRVEVVDEASGDVYHFYPPRD